MSRSRSGPRSPSPPNIGTDVYDKCFPVKQRNFQKKGIKAKGHTGFISLARVNVGDKLYVRKCRKAGDKCLKSGYLDIETNTGYMSHGMSL